MTSRAEGLQMTIHLPIFPYAGPLSGYPALGPYVSSRARSMFGGLHREYSLAGASIRAMFRFAVTGNSGAQLAMLWLRLQDLL